MTAIEQLKAIVDKAIDDHAAYALDDEEQATLVDGIVEGIVAAGWPMTEDTFILQVPTPCERGSDGFTCTVHHAFMGGRWTVCEAVRSPKS
jgi:hypothetical protein